MSKVHLTKRMWKECYCHLRLQESDYTGFKFSCETENWYLVSRLKILYNTLEFLAELNWKIQKYEKKNQQGKRKKIKSKSTFHAGLSWMNQSCVLRKRVVQWSTETKICPTGHVCHVDSPCQQWNGRHWSVASTQTINKLHQ